jgi:hypothetical protein
VRFVVAVVVGGVGVVVVTVVCVKLIDRPIPRNYPVSVVVVDLEGNKTKEEVGGQCRLVLLLMLMLMLMLLFLLMPMAAAVVHNLGSCGSSHQLTFLVEIDGFGDLFGLVKTTSMERLGYNSKKRIAMMVLVVMIRPFKFMQARYSNLSYLQYRGF